MEACPRTARSNKVRRLRPAGTEMLASQLLRTAFTGIVKRGTLEVVTSRGHVFKVGDGRQPWVAIRFADAAAEWALCLDPELQAR